MTAWTCLKDFNRLMGKSHIESSLADFFFFFFFIVFFFLELRQGGGGVSRRGKGAG